MDPNTAPTTPSNQPEERSGFSLRRLWQVPVFVLGIVALVTVGLTRSLIAPEPARQLHHDLSEARRLLHHRSGDADEALRHAQQAVDAIMYDPSKAPEAFYLLGASHIRVAESSAGQAAADHWREAKQCLEEADRRGLAGDDANRMHYLSAKVGFYTNDDPRHVIALLRTNKESADDRAEAYSLLSQAYLRLNPPNLKEALLANEELRQKVPQVGEDVLGPAKLAGAKILMRLGRSEDARKTLEKINDQAPAAVLSEARLHLAGLFQGEGKFSEAAERWRAALNDKRQPPSDPGGALYNLGVCCGKLDRASEAAEAWSECLRRTHGEEAQAAALALAELRLRETQSIDGQAVELLSEAVAKIRKASDWQNSLWDLARVRELFERAAQTYRQANRFDFATQTAELYERVAVTPKAQLLRADLCGEWARQRQEQARKIKDASARKKEEAAVRGLFRQAADAHAEAAKLLSDKAKKAERLWLSAVCCVEGEDHKRAALKLEKIVQSDGENNVERLSEGWHLLGETYRQLHDREAAEKAYKNCIAYDSRFTCRARYQLALLDIEAGRIDQAAANLDQNLKLEHHDPDPEAQDKSRFALCSLLYQGGPKFARNYRRVVALLEGALERAPLSPEAVLARYQLADSYRQLAAQRFINHYMSEKLSTDAHKHYLEENRRSLARAAEEFAKLEQWVDNPELCSLLSVKQRVETPFVVAECNFNLGNYEKALNKYEALAKKWGTRPEGLWALGETVRCHGAMGDYEKLRQRVEDIRKLLPTVLGFSDADRKYWHDWLAQVSKKLPPPEKESHHELNESHE